MTQSAASAADVTSCTSSTDASVSECSRRVMVSARTFSGRAAEKKASVASLPLGALNVKVNRVVSELSGAAAWPWPLTLGAMSTRSRSRMQNTALSSAATTVVPGGKKLPKVSPRL